MVDRRAAGVRQLGGGRAAEVRERGKIRVVDADEIVARGDRAAVGGRCRAEQVVAERDEVVVRGLLAAVLLKLRLVAGEDRPANGRVGVEADEDARRSARPSTAPSPSYG